VMPALVGHQISMNISKSIDQIVYGNPQEAQVAVDRLKWLPVSSTSMSQLVDAYSNETRTERKNVLKRYYKEITGEDIEDNFSND